MQPHPSPTSPDPAQSSTPISWAQHLVRRMGILWPLKAFGTMAFMGLFFWIYFAILHAPSATPLAMPLTALDRMIPVSAAAFPIYAGLWVYVSLPPAFLRNFRELAEFTLWISLLCVLCLAIFWFFPTAVPPTGIDWTLYPQAALIKGVDGAGNACPSLHVASAVFAACWLAVLLREVGAPALMLQANILFCLAILWSTVATRQHVVLDVVGGTAIGLAFAWPALRSYARSRIAQDVQPPPQSKR